MRKSRLKVIQQLAERDEKRLIEEVAVARRKILKEQTRVDELVNLLKGYSPVAGTSHKAHIFKGLQRFRTGLAEAGELQKAVLAMADKRLHDARHRWLQSHLKRKGIEAVEESRLITEKLQAKRKARRIETDKFKAPANPWSMLKEDKKGLKEDKKGRKESGNGLNERMQGER